MRCHTAMEGPDSGLLFLDAEDRVIFCNSRYRQVYEIQPTLPLQGLRFSEVVRWGFEHHADELFGRTVDAAVAERRALHRVQIEPWEIHLRKLQRWVLASDRPTLDGGVVCLRTDITALKTTEAALQAHTELLELAISSSSAGLCHWQRSTGELRLTPGFLA
jgi:rsbT co-antagonist protein RsbR